MERSVIELAAEVSRRHPQLSRRDVLELAAFTAALAACGRRRREAEPAAGGEPAPAGGGATAAKSPLDPRAYRALEAATARILPGADGFASAREAHVMTFIDRQLAVPPLARVAPALLALARGLDAQAVAHGGPDFAGLGTADQDAILDTLSRGTWPDPTLPQPQLFRVLHGLTLEGFLSDPVHGGNHDGVGWKAIGFPEPALRRAGGAGPGHGHGHGG